MAIIFRARQPPENRPERWAAALPGLPVGGNLDGSGEKN
jgi:hypothetical protein